MNKKIAIIIALALLLTPIAIHPPTAFAVYTTPVLVPPVKLMLDKYSNSFNLHWVTGPITDLEGGPANQSGSYTIDSYTGTSFDDYIHHDSPGAYYTTTGFGLTFTGHNNLLGDGNWHTVAWTAGTCRCYNTSGNQVWVNYSAGSFITKLPANTCNWTDASTFGLYAAPTVTISGSHTAAIGVPTTLGANATAGAPPYQYQWTVTSDIPAEDYVTARTADLVNFSHTYSSVLAYQIQVQVWDSQQGTATSAIWTLNGQSQKPVMHGELVLLTALGTMPDFGMYTDANSNPNGVVAWTNCVPTSQYVVTWPDIGVTDPYFYQLSIASSYPNPLVVTTRYTDAGGHEWTYSFSFDTSQLTGPETYTKSDGTGGNVSGEAPPTWLAGVLQWLKTMLEDLLKWAFVPTTAQMNGLIPGGSLGAALVDQTTWGTGSGSWVLTVHAGGFALPLVNVSFDTINSWSFVTVIRTGIQAVMCVGLIYMIVTLI